MSKLDDLINKLCPDGVEFKELVTLAEIGTGSSDRKDAAEDGKYPFYVRSKDVLRINSFEYDEEAIVIPGEGGIGEIFHYVSGKYALHQRAYRIHPTTEKLSTRFLYYYMFANFKSFIMQKAVSATVTSIRKPMIEKFEVPVPPLEIQNEIVRILDNFSELEEELEEELEARRKQYEYYRDSLLSFDDSVEWKPLGELFEFKNGLNKEKGAFGKGKTIVNFTDVYNKRWLTKDLLNGLVDVDIEEQQRYSAKKGDLFFTRTSETKEDVGMASVLLDDIDGCVFSGFVLRARPQTDLFIPKFCSYYLTTPQVRKVIVKYASFTTRALTSGPRLCKIPMPIISKEWQEYIVSILDRFEALCNDITSGLPAEIEARHKQYEYYRDKLLTFKRKSA